MAPTKLARARVQRNVRNHRNIDRRTPDVHQIDKPLSQQDSRHAARNGEHYAFGEKLAFTRPLLRPQRMQ